MGILIQNTISKFSKTKIKLLKRPNKVPKIQKPKIKLKKDPPSSKKSKTYIRRPQIKKFYKTYPTKNGNSVHKYNFLIFKNKNQTQKRPPKVKKNQKHI